MTRLNANYRAKIVNRCCELAIQVLIALSRHVTANALAWSPVNYVQYYY